MPTLLNTTLNALEAGDVPYILYKSLNHLEEDLQGLRGDLDMFVPAATLPAARNILHQLGWKRDRTSSSPEYWWGLDPETHRAHMIDLSCDFPFGPKPCKPYTLEVDPTLLQVETRCGVRVLADADYAPLMALFRLMSARPKAEDLEELKHLVEKPLGRSHIRDILEGRYHLNWAQLVRDLTQAGDWAELDSYRAHLAPQLGAARMRLWKHRFRKLLRYVVGFRRRVLAQPRYRVRKRGFLVAMVGVDGAGKSSAIEHILGLDYFKKTGIRSLYFGNNGYWIPGLTTLMAQKNKSPAWERMLGVASRVDRQLRLVAALFFMHSGNIVLADRYFYDDFIGATLQPKLARPWWFMALKALVAPRMWRKADLTLFLDASPESAYARKQDYPFEKMKKINTAYKAYMKQVPHVVRIDTDRPQPKVWHDIIEALRQYDTRS